MGKSAACEIPMVIHQDGAGTVSSLTVFSLLAHNANKIIFLNNCSEHADVSWKVRLDAMRLGRGMG
jgi:hypothetical protein